VGEWNFRAVSQEKIGSVYKLRGTPSLPVEIEDATMLLRALEVDYDEETGDRQRTRQRLLPFLRKE